MSENIPEPEKGFIYQKDFYPLSISEKGKDLLLIDRLTQRPPDAIFSELEAGVDIRGPAILALIATSFRAAYPEWPLQRIINLVEEIELSELEWVGTEDDGEEETVRPPDEGEGSQEPSPKSNEPQASRSETPSVTPA